ncbi:galactose/glucose ABC transporter substrate-binding protein MglB [Escherichia coli]|nr:galactose/glucose ABC transporter substrate-binding protein MglB [Escherichia coli]EFW53863.1 Galactose/methyl galactoside ABC transport system, D-galactose-binding periplasmic protein MglB [Shigella boydii ATCC 9905]EFZ4918300.1 galactose/glucose ABC transporter substrate-binding protein MglB [Shigella boydii]RIF70788.1 galactose/glucose ABC transporter substrate-binding protein MglB [Shigella boydii]
MITIRDVARQAGVSVATVSRVLNNSTLVSADTREAVMKAVSELDYRPNANAQALATQVSDTIGVVVMDVSDAFFGALVKAVDLVQGWDLNKDGQIQFVLLKGEPGHPDAEARTTYVIKELNDKGIKTEQLQLDTAMWDTAQAKDKMDAWLSGPNANKIEVVIANNDAMAMGAVEALKAHNKSSIPVFGVDALPEALALVKSGALAGTVLNDANNQAKATFDLAKNLADGKGAADGTNWKIDNKVVRVPYVGVDKDNLAEFSKK